MPLLHRTLCSLPSLLAGVLITLQPSVAQTAVAPAPPPPAAVQVAQRPAIDISGSWNSTFGTVTLRHTQGAQVEGEYVYSGGKGTITGTLADRTLKFSYTETSEAGTGEFVFAPDTRSFTGTYRVNTEPADESSPWNGKRAADPHSFTGLWETSYGPMRLNVTEAGDKPPHPCAGVYEFGGRCADITGHVEGRKFTFTYTEPDGVTGAGSFELDEAANQFIGTWKADKAPTTSAPGKWQGKRITPKPGVTWLVVLEANWESGLVANEYSYGEMLKTFFRRLPNVEFRHRFIHDRADVQRFAAEVRFIPEPVVLYFSSHGSPEGISVADGSVTPEQIAAVMRGASNIRLLHFGACEVMAGDAPARLIRALEGTASFPISGFANAADWGGSAIVDFTYLDLVLEHNMEPRAAVEETRRTVLFARNRDPNGPGSKRGPISPSLLTLYEPSLADISPAPPVPVPDDDK